MDIEPILFQFHATHAWLQQIDKILAGQSGMRLTISVDRSQRREASMPLAKAIPAQILGQRVLSNFEDEKANKILSCFEAALNAAIETEHVKTIILMETKRQITKEIERAKTDLAACEARLAEEKAAALGSGVT